MSEWPAEKQSLGKRLIRPRQRQTFATPSLRAA